MKHCILIAVYLLWLSAAPAATKRVLFIGNSYTDVNNLPLMVANVANSMMDTVVYDSNVPGGYTFEAHLNSAASLSKIASGNWDFVVLQEQSQRPSFPLSQVQAEVFPYAHVLDSLVNAHSSCGETVFYMTWGRKNGDASNCAVWPPVCTYQGMDSLLHLRYRMMADSNQALLAPAGAVWNYIRQNFPLIELYQTDGSHPSLAGTYAIACTFYSTLFRANPLAISFNPGIPATEATAIRDAVKIVVYDSLLHWNVGRYDSINAITCVTGIEELANTLQVKVFPNPFSSHTVLQLNKNINDASVILLNGMGQQVMQWEGISGNTIELPRASLAAGTYTVLLSESKKLIKAVQVVVID